MVEPAVGERYADPASPGRVVEIIAVGSNRLVIETVVAADAAVSSHAVGKQTTVTTKTFARFKKVSESTTKTTSEA